MSSHITTLIILATILYSTIAMQQSGTPALCEPGLIEEMPNHIKKVCIALENSNQLSNALNAYIKNEGALQYKTDDLLQSNTGKRTDVDHVFLRFGRRR